MQRKFIVLITVLTIILSSFSFSFADASSYIESTPIPSDKLATYESYKAQYDVAIVLSGYSSGSITHWDVYGYNISGKEALHTEPGTNLTVWLVNMDNGSFVWDSAGGGTESGFYIKNSTGVLFHKIAALSTDFTDHSMTYYPYVGQDSGYVPDEVTISARTGQQLTFMYIEDKEDVFLDAEATGNQIIHQIRHTAGVPFGGFLAGTNRYAPLSNIPSTDYTPFAQVLATGGIGASSLYSLENMWVPTLGALQRLTIVPSGDQQFVTITVDNNKCVWTKSSAVTGVVISSNFDEGTLGEDMPDETGQGTQGWIPDGYDDAEALEDGVIERNFFEDFMQTMRDAKNGLINLFNSATNGMYEIIGQIQDFLSQVAGMYMWLPSHLRAMITLAFGIIISVTILKFVLEALITIKK